MIIPIRCFTCGEVIGDKWNPFIQLITEKKNKS
ncbi:MAG: DNA-directed RNA polymerase subunit N, partial [Acidimicrobiaceae bacterium]|nr:DNA-directed RNA polymerase subunit N [Acidimicrobiaceae bacterium]